MFDRQSRFVANTGIISYVYAVVKCNIKNNMHVQNLRHASKYVHFTYHNSHNITNVFVSSHIEIKEFVC